jgi:hypothetical protein
MVFLIKNLITKRQRKKKPVAEFAEEGSDLQNKIFDKIPDKKL